MNVALLYELRQRSWSSYDEIMSLSVNWIKPKPIRKKNGAMGHHVNNRLSTDCKIQPKGRNAKRKHKADKVEDCRTDVSTSSTESRCRLLDIGPSISHASAYSFSSCCNDRLNLLECTCGDILKREAFGVHIQRHPSVCGDTDEDIKERDECIMDGDDMDTPTYDDYDPYDEYEDDSEEEEVIIKEKPLEDQVKMEKEQEEVIEEKPVFKTPPKVMIRMKSPPKPPMSPLASLNQNWKIAPHPNSDGKLRLVKVHVPIKSDTPSTSTANHHHIEPSSSTNIEPKETSHSSYRTSTRNGVDRTSRSLPNTSTFNVQQPSHTLSNGLHRLHSSTSRIEPIPISSSSSSTISSSTRSHRETIPYILSSSNGATSEIPIGVHDEEEIIDSSSPPTFPPSPIPISISQSHNRTPPIMNRISSIHPSTLSPSPSSFVYTSTTQPRMVGRPTGVFINPSSQGYQQQPVHVQRTHHEMNGPMLVSSSSLRQTPQSSNGSSQPRTPTFVIMLPQNHPRSGQQIVLPHVFRVPQGTVMTALPPGGTVPAGAQVVNLNIRRQPHSSQSINPTVHTRPVGNVSMQHGHYVQQKPSYHANTTMNSNSVPQGYNVHQSQSVYGSHHVNSPQQSIQQQRRIISHHPVHRVHERASHQVVPSPPPTLQAMPTLISELFDQSHNHISWPSSVSSTVNSPQSSQMSTLTNTPSSSSTLYGLLNDSEDNSSGEIDKIENGIDHGSMNNEDKGGLEDEDDDDDDDMPVLECHSTFNEEIEEESDRLSEDYGNDDNSQMDILDPCEEKPTLSSSNTFNQR